MNEKLNSDKIEILSPAGNFDSVVAAVFNGANAVYLGQKNLNARQNANNFDEEELRETIEFCHLHNVLVYQTLNTIVFDEEEEILIQTLKTACELSVDALIIQDLGVLRYVKKYCPNIPIHASTQMTVHTLKGAQLLKDLGVCRVVLAREMSIEQIKEISQNIDIEIEIFVHGALCMSVSGQCYMSSIIGGRSANKGNCAGACRLPHIVEDSENEYALSLKDLCTVDIFDELVKIGVKSFKIEGRMKRPEYVAAVTKAYADLKKGDYPDMELVRAVYARSGFTDGYLTDNKNKEMFGYRQKDDVIVATNDIFKEIAQTYHKQKQLLPINMNFVLKDKTKAKLTVLYKDITVTVDGEIPQTAINRPLDEQSAKDSFQKLGDTPYYLENFTCEIDEGIMLPKSALNQMRREAIQSLNEIRLNNYGHEFSYDAQEKEIKSIVLDKKTRVRFSSFKQMSDDIVENVEFFYLPLNQVVKNKEQLIEYTDKIIIELPRLMLDDEKNIIQDLVNLKKQGFNKASASNIAHVEIANELDYTLFGTSFLNISNTSALKQYENLNVHDTEIAIEMTTMQINKLGKTNQKLGALAYGKLPLMLFANCPVKANIGCRNCGGCGKITDRLSNEFEVVCQDKKYSEIINFNPINIADRQNEFKTIDYFTLYFTTENTHECIDIYNDFINKKSPINNFTRGLYYRGLTTKN